MKALKLTQEKVFVSKLQKFGTATFSRMIFSGMPFSKEFCSRMTRNIVALDRMAFMIRALNVSPNKT